MDGWLSGRGGVASGFPCPYCGQADWSYITGIEGSILDLECPADAMQWTVNTHAESEGVVA